MIEFVRRKFFSQPFLGGCLLSPTLSVAGFVLAKCGSRQYKGRGGASTIGSRPIMTVAQEFEAANQQYVASFTKGNLALPPARKVAVVVCMDARIDPAAALGLSEGDAHVIRNAGGRSSDALRSVIILQRLLGTKEIVVIHHTDCGMLTFSDNDLRGIVKEQTGHSVDHFAFLPFLDLEQSVREDVEFFQKSPLVADVPVSGYIYDVKTGAITKVE